MNLIGFEEPHLRRENNKFCFERNKKKAVVKSLLMKKEKSPGVCSSPLFCDPLSSNPMHKKLKAEIISAAIFQKKPMAAAPINP